MPVRIYALAKELKLDSKELVDLCTRIGIPNKGSALASLEDDEVSRIRKYLAGGSGPESGSSSAGSSPSRPTGGAGIGAPIRETPVLPPLTPPSREKEPAAPTAKAPAAVPTPVAAPPAPLARPTPQPVAETVVQPVAKQVAPPEPPAAPAVVAPPAPRVEAEPPRQGITKEDYIAPPSSEGMRMRVIGRKTAGSAPAKPAADATKKPPQRREPVIKLASIPRGHAAPTAAPKSNEPAPQKPEIRLTPEQFAGMGKGGPAAETPAQSGGAAGRRPKPAPLPTPGDGPVPGRGPAAPGKGGLTQFTDKAKGKKGRTAEEEEEVNRKAAGIEAARDERKRRRPRHSYHRRCG